MRTPRTGREVVVVILAGGQGERLSMLSSSGPSRPSPFGGEYRIIDFALSNCVNRAVSTSRADAVPPASRCTTTSAPASPWDLDRQCGRRAMLQPYLGRRGADWYRGTADAVYQNIYVLARAAPSTS